MAYANRLIRLDFSDWSENPEEDPIWVVIRNPKLVPPAELNPDIAVDEQGRPLDQAAAVESMHVTISRLVRAWRVYDATEDVQVDPVTGEELPGESKLLSLPATPALVAKLPTEFLTRIAREITDAVNPQ